MRDLDRLAFHPRITFLVSAEHFQVTRNFLNRREVFLDVLLSDDEEA